MRTHRRFGVIVLVLTALLAGSGVAWAQTDEADVIEVEDSEDAKDTLFNFGYDIFSRVLLWNLSALDGIYDCTLENGPLTATTARHRRRVWCWSTSWRVMRVSFSFRIGLPNKWLRISSRLIPLFRIREPTVTVD